MKSTCPTPIFGILRTLEDKGIQYRMEGSSESIIVYAAVFGKRIEIHVSNDGGVATDVFSGSNGMLLGGENLNTILED